MLGVDALGAWLVEQLADAGRKKLTDPLLGSDQERALQQAATAAIQATARQWRPEPATTDDPKGADHLARVIDQVFQQAPTPTESLAGYPTLLQGLQTGVTARLVALDDADVTGTGRSSAEELGVPGIVLADSLTSHLVQEIMLRGARGGPLTPLSDQLNYEKTHRQSQRIETKVDRLIGEVRDTLVRPGDLKSASRAGAGGDGLDA
jgi:hypothetical protein